MDSQVQGIFVNRKYRALVRRPYSILMGGIAITLVMAAWLALECVDLYAQSSLYKNEALVLKNRISEDKEMVEKYRQMSVDLEKIESINGIIRSVEKYGEINPLDILGVIERTIPDDVSVETLRFNEKTGQVNLKTRASDRRSMTVFVQKIESNNMFDGISLNERESERGGYSFELSIGLLVGDAGNHRSN